MRANFDDALKEVLKHEGGYVNHPKDPGGATNKGITQKTYDAWRKKQKLPTRSVREIERDEVEEIYRHQYWDKVRGDDLPSGVDYAVFDFAVNSGPARAAKCLQGILGVEVDGKIGPQTLAAADGADDIYVIESLCDRRMMFLQDLSSWPTFGKGWTRRVNEVRALAKTMVC